MKRNSFKISSLFLIVGLSLISLAGNSQDRNLTRQEQKEVRKAEMALNFQVIDSLLESRQFVLKADYLQDRYGDQAYVPSGLNFVKVDGTDGVIQTGTYTGVGSNGVGGATAEGAIDSWKVSKNFSNHTFTIQFKMFTNLGSYDILLTVNSDNKASARIAGIGPGNLSWNGHLESLDGSGVFKARLTY